AADADRRHRSARRDGGAELRHSISFDIWHAPLSRWRNKAHLSVPAVLKAGVGGSLRWLPWILKGHNFLYFSRSNVDRRDRKNTPIASPVTVPGLPSCDLPQFRQFLRC